MKNETRSKGKAIFKNDERLKNSRLEADGGYSTIS